MDLPPLTAEDFAPERYRKLREIYGHIYTAAEELFFHHDPIAINFETNTDEYAPEVSTVLPRLHGCSSATDVQRVLHEEFSRWFGVEVAGSFKQYARMAVELWIIWRDFKASNPN